MNQPENVPTTGPNSTTDSLPHPPLPDKTGVSPAPAAGADRRVPPASPSSPRIAESSPLPLLTHAQHLVNLVESGTATFRSESGYRLKDHAQWCTFYTAVKLEERQSATRPEPSATVAAPATRVTNEMVNRFLCWRLPATFNPDGPISFDSRCKDPQSHWWPVGTNLLNANEAREMLAHVLGADPSQAPIPVGAGGIRPLNRVTEGADPSPTNDPAAPVITPDNESDWEERDAWSTFAACSVRPNMTVKERAAFADQMLVERRKRFPMAKEF